MPCGDKEGQNGAGQDEIERHNQGIRLPSKQVGQPHHPCLNGVNRRNGFIVGQAGRHQLVVNMCAIANKGGTSFGQSLRRYTQRIQKWQP